MKKFLSCDWGTSSLRIRLFDAVEQKTLGAVSGTDGILATHEAWKNSGENTNKRIDHYRTVLSTYVLRLQSQLNEDLLSLPMIVSGMASSSIGICPLPYSALPFSLDGSGLQNRCFDRQDKQNEIFMISGVRSANDVMRGEETELIGLAALEELPDSKSAQYIFPGTHSKHITVRDKRAHTFKTYMTGEVFALLSEKSILRSAMHSCEFGEPGTKAAFERGVKDASDHSLLHRIFSLRANELFGIGTPGENYFYLSGLLIGYELLDLDQIVDDQIFLCSQGRLQELYQAAITILGHEKKTRIFSAQTADIAVAVGQFKIYQNNT